MKGLEDFISHNGKDPLLGQNDIETRQSRRPSAWQGVHVIGIIESQENRSEQTPLLPFLRFGGYIGLGSDDAFA